MTRLLLILSLLVSVPVAAQDRPIAGSTVQTTDTSANSLLVGCTVGSTTCTGGIKANTITPVTTLTIAGLLSVTGFGTHAFSAGSNSVNVLKIENTTSNTTAWARVNVTAGTAVGFLDSYSQGYTTGSYDVQSSTALVGQGSGGLSIAASHASGAIRFYSGGTTLRHDISNTGTHNWYNTNGTTVSLSFTPGAGAAGSVLALAPTANSTGNVTGNGLRAGRNTSGNGAAGWLDLTDRNGTNRFLWADAAGDLRISTVPPDEDGTPSDTSGTVVGTQTSQRSTKNVIGEFADTASALAAILRTPLYRFTYKTGSYNNTEFVGIMAEESPEFVMDLGRSFNPVSAFGYTVGAIKALEARIAALEKQVAGAR